MDSKIYLIYVLLGFIRSSYQSDIWDRAKVDVKYYMNIKTSVDLQWMNREDNAQWKNDSFVGDAEWPRRKVKIDENDNCYLYLFKNQTSTIHGPVRIDSKHIALDIKYNMSGINFPKDRPQKEYMHDLVFVKLIRDILMESVFKVHFFDPAKDPLNIYLELDSETALLFPKIEKEDYFIFNIINFVDRISFPLGEDKTHFVIYPEKDPNSWVVVSHSIFNYTILSPDANEIKV